MKTMKRKSKPLDFIVDRLTKSIELATTGERFETKVLPIEKADMKFISKRAGWKFDWQQEIAAGAKVYKLVAKTEPGAIQGLAAFFDAEGYIEMSLLESAPFNIGKGKKFDGVAGNLVAFGCLLSLQKGFDGVLSFVSKTKLMEHYHKSFGAVHIGNQRMTIFETKAAELITRYFPNFTSKENNHE